MAYAYPLAPFGVGQSGTISCTSSPAPTTLSKFGAVTLSASLPAGGATGVYVAFQWDGTTQTDPGVFVPVGQFLTLSVNGFGVYQILCATDVGTADLNWFSAG